MVDFSLAGGISVVYGTYIYVAGNGGACSGFSSFVASLSNRLGYLYL